MDASHDTDRCDRTGLVWVRSMGGPLIVVPESSVGAWGGCTEDGSVLGDADGRDDYDRACEVEDLAGVIAVGTGTATALVLADEPAKTCFLPETLLFVRWLAADSEAEVFTAAAAVLADPDTAWEDSGLWVTDGPAVLMDSAEAGADPGVNYPHGGHSDQAPVQLPAGQWKVRAVHRSGDFPWVGLVQLVVDNGRS
ncbi:Imm21 family immunity protein [Streptomyces sp. AM 2-1-1]|uniref:Imm21 family immunity protein n=1 Tax=Streptomyces sp. AM 2-1-1 TaxID=3028709 RepID=UPI0023B930D7|nr:Imm21 family immunity protein [Streptomyces sp. AM 2-1-1]WEH43434.1 Imm21 family immunity protein [Streptomyces sp. AM 2-1-1]